MASRFWDEWPVARRAWLLALPILATTLTFSFVGGYPVGEAIRSIPFMFVFTGVLLVLPCALLLGTVRSMGLYVLGLVAQLVAVGGAFLEADAASARGDSMAGVALLDAPVFALVLVAALAAVEAIHERRGRRLGQPS